MDGRVDGVAFSKAAHGAVGGVDVAKIAAAAQDGLGIAPFLGKGDATVHIFLDAGIFFKILLDDIGSLAA